MKQDEPFKSLAFLMYSTATLTMTTMATRTTTMTMTKSTTTTTTTKTTKTTSASMTTTMMMGRLHQADGWTNALVVVVVVVAVHLAIIQFISRWKAAGTVFFRRQTLFRKRTDIAANWFSIMHRSDDVLLQKPNSIIIDSKHIIHQRLPLASPRLSHVYQHHLFQWII